MCKAYFVSHKYNFDSTKVIYPQKLHNHFAMRLRISAIKAERYNCHSSAGTCCVVHTANVQSSESSPAVLLCDRWLPRQRDDSHFREAVVHVFLHQFRAHAETGRRIRFIQHACQGKDVQACCRTSVTV